MVRPKKNLNDRPKEYIEENFLSANPQGLPEMDDTDSSEKIVIAYDIHKTRRVEFVNMRDPGQELMFHYHSKTHPLKHYTLFHGKQYDLPEEIIEHLEQCAEPVYGYRTGHSGHPEMYRKSSKYIFQCKTVRRVA